MKYDEFDLEIVITAELQVEMYDWLEDFLEKAGAPDGQRGRLDGLNQGELQAVLQSFQQFSWNIKEEAEYKGYALNDFDPDE